jgi:hypothetical protein
MLYACIMSFKISNATPRNPPWCDLSKRNISLSVIGGGQIKCLRLLVRNRSQGGLVGHVYTETRDAYLSMSPGGCRFLAIGIILLAPTKRYVTSSWQVWALCGNHGYLGQMIDGYFCFVWVLLHAVTHLVTSRTTNF